MKAKILADFQIRISVPFTHLTPLVLFYTPRKHEKSRGALIFSWGIKRDQFHEIG